MKIIRKSLLLLLLTVAIVACLVISSSAADGSEDAVWKITHKDGSIDYSESFSGAFSNIKAGDRFELLPEVYYLYKKGYATVNAPGDITIDMRGKTVFAPDIGDLNVNASIGDVNAQVFDVKSSSGARIKFLLEGAEIYAALGGRSAFSVSGNVFIELDGGKLGGSVSAPATINAMTVTTDKESYSVMRNIRSYKCSQNMNGNVCARNEARLMLIDCTVYSPGNSHNPLIIRDTAKVVLDNTFVGTKDNGTAIDFISVGSGASLEVRGGSRIYGKINGAPSASYVTLAPGTRYSKSVGGFTLSGTERETALTVSETFFTSSAEKKIPEGKASAEYVYTPQILCENIEYAYTLAADTTLYPSYSQGLRYKLKNKTGDVFYASSLGILSLPNEIVEAELCETLSAGYSELIYLSDELTLRLSKSAAATDTASESLFITEGQGSLRLILDGAAEAERLVYARHSGELSIESSLNSKVGELCTSLSASVSVSGGGYIFGDGAIIAPVSNVSLSGVLLQSDATEEIAIICGDKITVSGTTLLVPTSKKVISASGETKLSGENKITGKISTGTLVTVGINYLTEMPAVTTVGEEELSDVKIDLTCPAIQSSAVGLIPSERTVTFYVVTEKTVITDEKEIGSVWCVTQKDGTVGYTKSVRSPLGAISEYTSLSLLCDLELEDGFSVILEGDVLLSLDERKISYSSENGEPLFSVGGVGKLTVSINGATVSCGDSTFLDVREIVELNVTGDGAYVESGAAVSSDGVKINIVGGSYITLGNYAFSVVGAEYSAKMTTIVGKSLGNLIQSDSDVILNEDTYVLAALGAGAVRTDGKLYAAGSVKLYGGIAAQSVVADFGCMFSAALTLPVSAPVVPKRASLQIEIPTLDSGEVKTEKTKYIFGYVTERLDSGLLASFTFSGAVALNAYVPDYIAKAADFRMRISINGILYDAPASDGVSVSSDGVTYKRFTYPYVYPDDYSSEVTISAVSGDFKYTKRAVISDLLCRSFEAAKDEAVKTVIATYTEYSRVVSAENELPNEQMASYVLSYRDEGRKYASIRKYLDYVRFDTDGEALVIAPSDEIPELVTVRYTFGKRGMIFKLSQDTGELSLPIFRLAPNGVIRFFAPNEDGENEELFSADIHSFISSLPSGSVSGSLMKLYGAYIQAIAAEEPAPAVE